MKTAMKKENNLTSKMVSFVKKAWISLLLIVVAVVMVGIGVYFNSHSYWANKTDVSLFNAGMEAYSAGDQVLPTDGDRPEEQAVIRAVAYLQQAYSETDDANLGALAQYNTGTIMGFEGLKILDGSTPLFVIKEAIAKLAEAIRLDPNNEAAKYNLELLEKVQSILEPVGGIPVTETAVGSLGGLSGYSSGVIYKGY
ncbi:MAG: hypothetical protein PHF74_05190 [Dehalococcoidales bacterium]|nr:hypothetical protein [Dehalococcoidales bacterium]